MPRKAVVLLSGGLDSTTVLAIAREQGFECYALSFHYGQRHFSELRAAANVAHALGAVEHVTVNVEMPWSKSALTRGAEVPKGRAPHEMARGIPVTYVPARNMIFLAHALSWAESIGASDIFAGMNILDYSGYPDCRPEFNAAFRKTARLGTRRGAEGKRLSLLAPLQRLDKAGIVRLARRLKVPLELTWSCYQGGRRPCGRCDSCKLRARGFAAAGRVDPALSR